MKKPTLFVQSSLKDVEARYQILTRHYDGSKESAALVWAAWLEKGLIQQKPFPGRAKFLVMARRDDSRLIRARKEKKK